MENKKELMSYGLLASMILLFGFFSATKVYAFTITDITTSHGYESCEQDSSTFMYCWDTTSGQNTNYITKINMVTGSVVSATNIAQSGWGVGTLADCDISGS